MSRVSSKQTNFQAPTVQRFTSGSGTYNTPSGVKYIIVRAVGGGGGGCAAQNVPGALVGTGGNGAQSTFGISLITCNGGTGATISGPGSGGSVTVNSPAILIRSNIGQQGQGSSYTGATTTSGMRGGSGGSTSMGESGQGGDLLGGLAGRNGIANTGSGGGGGAVSGTNLYVGAGGGGGGYCEALIPNPSSSYSYSVGVGGTYVAGGATGPSGGNGAAGCIEVIEYYQ